jgi:hypothetical protein
MPFRLGSEGAELEPHDTRSWLPASRNGPNGFGMVASTKKGRKTVGYLNVYFGWEMEKTHGQCHATVRGRGELDIRLMRDICELKWVDTEYV